MEATDVGKPLTQARADVVALARYCEFYAGAADKVMGQTIPFQQGFTVYTLREPIGVTGHIVPWNYPMQIIGRSLGAALAMGNACVLKPAEEACLTALAFADLARQAGFPAGAINVVPGLGAEAGAALTAHPGVGHISFTGSVATGRLVQAAAAQNVVPVTLELGGKSPQLVFADADLDGPALPRERGAPERGADLLGLLPHPRGAVPVRRSGRAHGRRLPRQGRSTRDDRP
jgi:aldehyde dehydrogenase (NAD+)